MYSTRERLFIGLCLVYLLGPLLVLSVQSFAFRWSWPHLLPEDWWWEMRGASRRPLAWDYVLSPYSHVFTALKNTLLIGLTVAVLSTFIALPVGHHLARGQFRGKSFVEFLLSLPLLIPETAIAIALLMIFYRLGFAGNVLAIIIVQLIPTLPYTIRLVTAAWQNHSEIYAEEARVLGANEAQIRREITIPMLMPGLLVAALFAFLVSSNIFLLTFMLGLGQVETLPVLLFTEINGGAIDAIGAGIAIIAALPGILLLIFGTRYLKSNHMNITI